jgi:hypothetical protein
MNKQTTALLSSFLIIFVVGRNILEPSKTTWNYVMIGLGIAILAYNGYQFYQSRK